jgi:hypothetical protein
VPILKTNVNKIRIKSKKATFAIAELDSRKSAVPETNLLFLNESNKSLVVCFKLPVTEVKLCDTAAPVFCIAFCAFSIGLPILTFGIGF